MSASTEIGKKAKEYMNSGQLVPDEIVTAVRKGSINYFYSLNICESAVLTLCAIDGDSSAISERREGERMALRWISTKFCPSREFGKTWY